jgi:hypothetical protein
MLIDVIFRVLMSIIEIWSNTRNNYLPSREAAAEIEIYT